MLNGLHILMICITSVLSAACVPLALPSTPAPTSTPLPTLIPSPTPTPSPVPTFTPTPTATPIPPMTLTIRWPEQVSALEPVPVEVELIPPPGVSVTATVAAAVLDPEGMPYWLYELTPQPQEAGLYAAEAPLRLPLEPIEGDWRLRMHVQSTLEVEGKQELIFRPASVRFRDLKDHLPPGVDIHVPRAFVEAAAHGDQVAGGRVWRHRDGEIALWWSPGPTEPLVLNNAVVMLETTHDADAPPDVLDVEETEWGGRMAFLFQENWSGSEGGPAEALVVQGPDYRLYVLRIRAMGGETIPPLLRQVWETFAFVEKEG